MLKLAGIFSILFLGLVVTSPSVLANSVTDCWGQVCATISVPECVVSGVDFDIDVIGATEDNSGIAFTSFALYENADWSYTSDHKFKLNSGMFIDGAGLIFDDGFAGEFPINRPSGDYTYSFVFGQRQGMTGYSDAVAEVTIDFAVSSNLVALDVKPGSCPNPLNVNKRGVLSVAIVGTTDFDVTLLDPASLLLEGVAPIHYSYEDVATPFEPRTGKALEIDCTDAGPDGILDLTMKFKARDIVQALEDAGHELLDGAVIVVTVYGETADTGSCQSTIAGEDVVRIINNQ